MYADRMRIVVELGGSIARGQREREREIEASLTKYTCGRRDRRRPRVRSSRFWSVRQTHR